MEAVFPARSSALCRGRRGRTAAHTHRRRTAPVTFAEIKEVDEESYERMEDTQVSEESECSVSGSERRRPDVLHDPLPLGRQFAEFRRRRAHARRALLNEHHSEGSLQPAHSAPDPDTTLNTPVTSASDSVTSPHADSVSSSVNVSQMAIQSVSRVVTEPAALHTCH